MNSWLAWIIQLFVINAFKSASFMSQLAFEWNTHRDLFIYTLWPILKLNWTRFPFLNDKQENSSERRRWETTLIMSPCDRFKWIIFCSVFISYLQRRQIRCEILILWMKRRRRKFTPLLFIYSFECSPKVSYLLKLVVDNILWHEIDLF